MKNKHKLNCFFLLCSLGIWLILPTLVRAQEKSSTVNTCLSCHQEAEVLPDDFSPNDVHLAAGLTCAGCHGGDPTAEDQDEAMSRAKGFIGVPDREQIPEFCGRCHSHLEIMREYRPGIPTDQVEQYYTSMHGKLLKKGDKKVAVCISCHTSHGILGAKDPRSTVYPKNVPSTCKKCHADPQYMAEYGIPTDQYEKYTRSVHGKGLLEEGDIGMPACNDCHGNHGAMPPGASSVVHICGICHVNNMNYFLASPMSKAFSKRHYHACEKCHGKHEILRPDDDFVGTDSSAICIDCHKPGEKPYQVADEIHQLLKRVTVTFDSAKQALTKVKKIGLNDIEIGYELQQAKQDLIHARTRVHFFNTDSVKKNTDQALTKLQKALSIANTQFHEYDIRRKGFAAATLVITLLVIGLYLKIKDIEKKQKEDDSK